MSIIQIGAKFKVCVKFLTKSNRERYPVMFIEDKYYAQIRAKIARKNSKLGMKLGINLGINLRIILGINLRINLGTLVLLY